MSTSRSGDLHRFSGQKAERKTATIKRLAATMEIRTGRPPTEEELAELLSISPRAVAQLRKLAAAFDRREAMRRSTQTRQRRAEMRTGDLFEADRRR